MKKIGELLNLLRVLTLVTGISNPQEGYNLNGFSNFLFLLIWRDCIWFPKNKKTRLWEMFLEVGSH